MNINMTKPKPAEVRKTTQAERDRVKRLMVTCFEELDLYIRQQQAGPFSLAELMRSPIFPLKLESGEFGPYLKRMWTTWHTTSKKLGIQP